MRITHHSRAISVARVISTVFSPGLDYGFDLNPLKRGVLRRIALSHCPLHHKHTYAVTMCESGARQLKIARLCRARTQKRRLAAIMNRAGAKNSYADLKYNPADTTECDSALYCSLPTHFHCSLLNTPCLCVRAHNNIDICTRARMCMHIYTNRNKHIYHARACAQTWI